MTSRRTVLSGAVLASLLAGGAWYSSEAFPLAARARVTAAGGAAQQAAPPAVNVVTPENPIPRRLFAPPIPYPVELAGTGISGAVSMQVVLGHTGSVTVTYTSTRVTNLPSGDDAARERAVEAFTAAATSAVAAWQYAPPFDAPLGFSVGVQFRPDVEAVASQSAVITGPGPIRSGSAEAAGPLRLQETLTVGQPSAVHTGAGVGGKTRHVDPVYPELARSARVGGIVILEANIDQRGRVSGTRILRSIPLLDQAALDAVRQWEYVPTMFNGVPVPIVLTLTIQFRPDL